VAPWHVPSAPRLKEAPRYGGDRRNRRSISLNNFIALRNKLLSQL